MKLTEKLTLGRLKKITQKWVDILRLNEWEINTVIFKEKDAKDYVSDICIDFENAFATIKLSDKLVAEEHEEHILFQLLCVKLDPFEKYFDDVNTKHSLSALTRELIALKEAATDPNTVEKMANRWKHAYDLKVAELEKAYDKLSKLKADNTMLGQANDIALATIAGKGEVKKLEEDNNNLKNKYQELHDKYDALCKENAKLKSAIKKSAAENNNNHLDKKKIEKIIDYYADGHSARETARHFQVSDSTVRKYVKQAGIHRSNKKLSEADKNQIVDLYKSGYSYRKIARHFGVNHASIRDVIKKNAA